MNLDDQYDLVCLVSNDISHDRRMIRTCTTLADQGWRILIIGRSLSEGGYGEQPFSFEICRLTCIFSKGPFFYIELLFRMIGHLRGIQYRRLLCVDIDTIGVLYVLNRRKEAKVYFDAHEYFTEVPELKQRPYIKKIWSVWAKGAVPRVDKCYTVGPQLAQILGQKYNKHFEVVRNVPPLSTHTGMSVDATELRLVYLGVLNPGRGLDILIEIVREHASLHLTIVGDGILYDQLREKADDHPQICFRGMMPPESLQYELAQYDLGVNLLTATSKSYYYSLANKFFDYIHAGLPVLCMNFPEYVAISGSFDCIYPVSSYDKEAVVNAIVCIDKHSQAWHHKRHQAYMAARQYNWEEESQRLLEIYDLKQP